MFKIIQYMISILSVLGVLAICLTSFHWATLAVWVLCLNYILCKWGREKNDNESTIFIFAYHIFCNISLIKTRESEGCAALWK